MDRLVPTSRATTPAARQYQLSDAENFGGEVSLQSLRGGNPMRTGANSLFLFLRPRKGDVCGHLVNPFGCAPYSAESEGMDLSDTSAGCFILGDNAHNRCGVYLIKELGQAFIASKCTQGWTNSAGKAVLEQSGNARWTSEANMDGDTAEPH